MDRNKEQRERVGQLPTPLVTKRELTEENDLLGRPEDPQLGPKFLLGKKA